MLFQSFHNRRKLVLAIFEGCHITAFTLAQLFNRYRDHLTREESVEYVRCSSVLDITEKSSCNFIIKPLFQFVGNVVRIPRSFRDNDHREKLLSRETLRNLFFDFILLEFAFRGCNNLSYESESICECHLSGVTSHCFEYDKTSVRDR